MSWMLASAAFTVGTSYISAQSNQNAAIRNANAVSKAEGQAIVKERMNTNIRNSYNTAISQMNLALTKRRTVAQQADITAATLAAKGTVDLQNASTGTVGASADAAISDIENKSQTALDMTKDQYEMAVENYNTELKMMVLNTDVSAPQMTPRADNTSSSLGLLGQSVLSGLGSFASNYAMQKLQLGLGPAQTSAARRTTDYVPTSGGYYGNFA